MAYFNLSFEPSFAYSISRILEKSYYNDIMLIEFHKVLNHDSYSEVFFEEFQKRSAPYYETFIQSSIVDRDPATISVAIKIAGEWFLAEDCGSNFYIGFGPGGILALRKVCLEKGILIHFTEEIFSEWVESKFGRPFKSFDIKNNNKSEFERLIKIFIDFGNDIQTARKTFSELKEENIRDVLIPIINGITKNRANAEAMSGMGKTDISVKTIEGASQHIFELKIWSGNKTLLKTIEQLVSYLNYQHDYAGILFFCKKKNLKRIIIEAKKLLYGKYSPVKLEEERESEIRFEMSYPSDIDKKLQIHIIFINLI